MSRKKAAFTVCCLLLLAGCARRTVIGPGTLPSGKRPTLIQTRPVTPAGARRVIPLELATLYLQALMAYHSGHYQQALSKLTAVLKVDHTFSEAYWARGEIYFDLEKFDQALRNYHQALQYDPQMIDAAFQLARIYLRQRKYRQAKEQVDYILALDARQPIALQLQKTVSEQAARHHLRKGRALLESGQRPQAIIALRRALESDPGLYQAWLELGRIQQEKGETAQALRSYQKALQIKDDLPLVWRRMGELYLQSAAYEQARHAFQHSLVLDPEQPEVQALLKQAQSNFYRLMKLPPQYLQISSSKQLSRGELAAVLAVNLHFLPHSANDSGQSSLIVPDISRHWAREFILDVIKRGWMRPYPNHDFLPEQSVSRGELAAILDTIVAAQSSGKPLKPLAKPIIFTDISPENQYYQAIMRISSLGLFSAYQQYEGTFLPDKAVSGVQALEIVDRLVEHLKRQQQ